MTTFPLTPSQDHLLKSQLITPEQPLFNQVVTATLSGDTFSFSDIQAMCEAWQTVQQLYPVLGTTIIESSSAGYAQKAGAAYSEMDVIDLNNQPGAFTDTLNKWISHRMRRTFEFDKSLTDAAVVRRGHNEIIIYLNMHHLIADAWSTSLVLEKLIHIFNSATNRENQSNQKPSSPELSEQEPTFFDYAVSLTGSQQPKFKRTLHENTPHSTLGAVLPSFYGHINDHLATPSTRKLVKLSDNDHTRLRKLADERELQQVSESLFQTCLHLTVLSIFLHKTSGDTELVIEVPLLGRFEQQWMNVAGNFIEMIRLSITVNADDTVLAVYKRSRDTLFESLRNAKPGCTSTLEPVAVHGVLNLITARQSSPAASRATFAWHHPGHSDLSHPLRLHVADWNATGTPTIELDLNHAFFVPPYIDRASAHLAATYRAVLESRETIISDFSIVTRSEKWTFTGREASADHANSDLLPARIEGMATAIPDAIALTDETSSVNYRELDKYAKNIESQLKHHGICKGQRVAVYLPRSLYLPIVLLGILRTGAAYVPIDRSQPELRAEEILHDAQVACLIADADTPLHPDILTLQVDALLNSSQPDLQAAASGRLPDDIDIDPANPAYMLYTSGSTGKPKGVVVSHGSLMSYLNWACGYYESPHSIVMPLFTSIGFDLTVTSLFLPWLSGGTMRVFPQTTDNQALLLLDVIQDKSLNTIKLTPAHLNILVNSEAENTSIRQLIVGGEDLKTETARQTANLFKQDVRIINEYGPTEATVGCIVREWRGDLEQDSVPIGLPIDGMSAYVLNDACQPQFEGVSGELYLSGPSLASGYWNDPETTAKAFIANPWRPDTRLYRTGDQVRVQHDELVYLGRTDGQLKINGHRVELAEIEATLLSHPNIKECVVLASQGKDNAEKKHEEHFCIECGLSSKYPDAQFDSNGVCSLCNSYKPNKPGVDEYFKNMDDLSELIKSIKRRRRGKYDALVLVSGGKDSTYTLSKLVDLGLKVYAFSLDNGFISDQAKQNVDYVCSTLGVAHHYASTPHMNSIFADSLERYSNVCDGCFKTIYNLSLKFAAEHDIDFIFTGLSRGQLFETRFNNELFSEFSLSPEKIDEIVRLPAFSIMQSRMPRIHCFVLRMQTMGHSPQKSRLSIFSVTVRLNSPI